MRLVAATIFVIGCTSRPAAPVDGGADDLAIGGGDDLPSGSDGASDGAMPRGFPAAAPWVSFYGDATQMGDLAKAAATFRILNIDVDPGAGNFTDPQIAQLRAGGQNRVISYLDVGSCEHYRSWWTSAPGFVACSANTAAQIGPYAGYPDETWMNVGDAAYQSLIVDYVAPLLAARGIDGFFLDNLEIVEHGTATTDGPCDAACAQGGLDLVRKLREKFPALLIVMQNATSDVTRLGMTGGVPFPSLLDGISHEEVFAPTPDTTAEMELLAWKPLGLSFIGTEDYVGDCTQTAAAMSAYAKSRADGFSPYATDASASQKVVCYWNF
jgi:cysteinyl-tRNA synthetase